MEVRIVNNPLKMLSHYFMAIVPLKAGAISVKGIYTCVHPSYGSMGQIECLNHYTRILNEIKAAEILMEGDVHFVENMKAQRLFSTDVMQCCVFRFLRRNDVVFQQMIGAETKGIGINFVSQPVLFS